MTENLSLTYSQGQVATLRVACDSLQDKYERLLEAHKRLQKVNQGLEDKLLRLVDRCESEKVKLVQDITHLKTSLVLATEALNNTRSENMRYKKDLNLAIQLLQCNPSHYVSARLDILPNEFREKIRGRVNPEASKVSKCEAKVIRVPIQTFPPTAMVYSVNKCTEDEEKEEVDLVSASILAAVLEERELERSRKHCPTCTCCLESKPSSKASVHSGNDEAFNINEKSTSHYNFYDKEANSSSDNPGMNRHSNVPFDIRAIDVGTQTLPSYIGESEKVTSTCIYCRSVKISSEGNGYVIGTTSDNSSLDRVMDELTSCKQDYDKRLDMKISPANALCSWDWHSESHDSGFPSSPTSLTSVSLSYDSEMSCFASPQDSPGHLSLMSCRNSTQENAKYENISSNVEGQRSSSKEELKHPHLFKKGIFFLRNNRSSSYFIGSHLEELGGERNVEKIKKRRNSKPCINKNDVFPSKISCSFQGLDSFTPIHVSPSGRLSSSDSDVTTTGGASFKTSSESSNVKYNRNADANNEPTQVLTSKFRSTSRESLSGGDVFVNGSFIGSEASNKLGSRTNWATETTL